MKKKLFLLVFTIMSYFLVNAQVHIDTLFLGNCELLNSSGFLSIHPKEYKVIMIPFFVKGKNVAIDLLDIPVEIDPELDRAQNQKAVENHPSTRWADEMETRVFSSDLMKMVENKVDSLGLKTTIYGSIYFDKKGKLLSYEIVIPSDILDFLTEELLGQFQAVCLDEVGGGNVPKNVLNSVFLRLSTEEFLESMKKSVLEYQEKMKKGKTPYRGHFFNHFLPIKDRPKSDYGKLEFRRYLNNSVE